MERLVIEGGQPLSGDIAVGGAKNAALKVIASTLLTNQPCRIENVPVIEDVKVLLEILSQMGATVEAVDEHAYTISSAGITDPKLPLDLAKKLRASIVLLGPLLARFGEVEFPHPGGCVIGQRPIDIFLDGFRSLGVEVTETETGYHCKAKKLQGSNFVFPRISVTATETLMMAACLAEGQTVLKFAACEPEVEYLAEYLNQRGAKIKGAGTHTITITGVEEMKGGDTTVIPDRIEVGTFAMLGAATRSTLTIHNCEPDHLAVPWKILHQAGVKFELGSDSVSILPSETLRAVNLVTHEYPGFVTDLQAPFTVLMTQAEGHSLIHETIYEGRLFYVDKLNKLGANIILCDPHRAVVMGPSKLFGGKIESPDIRAGIAMVIAALVAEGKSQIENVYQIDRGYEAIDARLQALGAKIHREKESA
ncbi:MAG: UDP-N-acetylglucosamine 1-carboxyvinyltransferase [bacterium]|nr:UDP-N-acetylglucosamine 1-carboxyvinyltransferase [bacterium]